MIHISTELPLFLQEGGDEILENRGKELESYLHSISQHNPNYIKNFDENTYLTANNPDNTNNFEQAKLRKFLFDPENHKVDGKIWNNGFLGSRWVDTKLGKYKVRIAFYSRQYSPEMFKRCDTIYTKKFGELCSKKFRIDVDYYYFDEEEIVFDTEKEEEEEEKCDYDDDECCPTCIKLATLTTEFRGKTKKRNLQICFSALAKKTLEKRIQKKNAETKERNRVLKAEQETRKKVLSFVDKKLCSCGDKKCDGKKPPKRLRSTAGMEIDNTLVRNRWLDRHSDKMPPLIPLSPKCRCGDFCQKNETENWLVWSSTTEYCENMEILHGNHLFWNKCAVCQKK